MVLSSSHMPEEIEDSTQDDWAQVSVAVRQITKQVKGMQAQFERNLVRLDAIISKLEQSYSSPCGKNSSMKVASTISHQLFFPVQDTQQIGGLKSIFQEATESQPKAYQLSDESPTPQFNTMEPLKLRFPSLVDVECAVLRREAMERQIWSLPEAIGQPLPLADLSGGDARMAKEEGWKPPPEPPDSFPSIQSAIPGLREALQTTATIMHSDLHKERGGDNPDLNSHMEVNDGAASDNSCCEQGDDDPSSRAALNPNYNLERHASACIILPTDPDLNFLKDKNEVINEFQSIVSARKNFKNTTQCQGVLTMRLPICCPLFYLTAITMHSGHSSRRVRGTCATVAMELMAEE